tara:strand:+ start:19 stop:480 length:462 start_codon:yes stop_codon:yes gene_type:complete
MPNWCINEVDISFHEDCTMEEQLRIRKAINVPLEDEPEGLEDNNWFSFGIIVPEPKHKKIPIEGKEPINYKYVLENGEKYDWYGWRNDNWGTKSDRSELYIADNDERNISMSFDTAWCPPEGVHDKVREILGDHAEMSWFYKEPGWELAGYLR